MNRDELQQDLQATSADVADDAEELLAIEHEKEALAPEKPATVDQLAERAEQLAQRIVSKTQMEKQLADELSSKPRRR